MAIQREIPTTVFVPPVPETEADIKIWQTQVAGFCRGSQSVKHNEDIISIRTGAQVHVEGEFNLDVTLLTIDILPVAPRVDGLLTVMKDGTNELIGLKYTAGSKSVDISALTEGKYYMKATYIAKIKGDK